MIEPTSLPVTSLYEKQQQASFITLLGAQKQLYIDAKRIRSIIFFFTLFFAVITPIINLFLPKQEDSISMIGGVISFIIAILLDQIPTRKAEMAAKVQERFDVELYELPENKTKVGEPVPDPIIDNANGRLKNRKNLAEPWYKNYDNKGLTQSILACQSENLYWDGEQKAKYVRFMRMIGLVVFAAGLAGAWLLDLKVAQYIVDILLPQFGLFTHIFLLIRNTNKSVTALTNKLIETKVLAESLEKEKIPIAIESLRKIQDFIFENRKNGVLVPEWYYWWHRRLFEKTLKATAERINQSSTF